MLRDKFYYLCILTKSMADKGKLGGWIMYTKNLERYGNNLHKNDMTFRDFKRYKSLETKFIYKMILLMYTKLRGGINES